MADYTPAKYDAIYKLTVIGDSQVGKTTIIRKFVDVNAPDHYPPTIGVGKTTIIRKFVDVNAPDHYPPTIGVDFGLKDITLGDERCRVQIWDTAGQERFRAVTSCYFRGAHGVVLVYDVTRASSFDNIQFHLAQAVQYTCDDQPMLMVGNKSDLSDKRIVPYELAKSYADTFDMPLVETSARTRANVEHAFLSLINVIRDRKKLKEKEKGGGGSGGGRGSDKATLFGSGGTLDKTVRKCCS